MLKYFQEQYLPSGVGMPRLKKSLKILLIILLLCALISVYGWSKWQSLKQQLGLEVDWQGMGIGLQGLTLDQLTVNQLSKDGSLIKIYGQDITLSWSTLSVKHLNIQKKIGDFSEKIPSNTTIQPEPFDLLGSLKQLSWLPNTVTIADINISLPCPKGYCITEGQLSLKQKTQPNLPFALQINLKHKEQKLDINANLYQQKQQLGLQVAATLNQQPLLTLSSQLDANTLKQWQGLLTISRLDNSKGLFEWLQDWLPTDQTFTEIPDALQLTAQWQLHFPTGLTNSKPDQGFLSINATLPNPWPFPKLGFLQGHIKARVSINQQKLDIDELQTDIKLTKIDKTLLKQLPESLYPDTVSFTLNPIEASELSTKDENIAFAFNLTSEGNLNASLLGNLSINTKQAEIQLTNSALQANTTKLTVTDYNIQNGRLSLPFTATITPEQTNIVLDKTAQLSLQQLKAPDITAKTILLSLANLTTQLNYQQDASLQASVSGPITLSTISLTAPSLKPISWKLAGQITGNLDQASFIGKISNGAELTADTNILAIFDKQLTITAKTPDIFLRTNPLSKTFSDWPDLLELATGKANIEGSLTVPFNNSPLKANGNIKFSGLSGIYDRSELRELTGSTTISVQNNQLKLVIPTLSLKEANPGIIMGPFQFSGQYSASLNKLEQGDLQWTKAELNMFSGKISLKSGQINLAKLPQELDLQITGLQLREIFKAYPTEGLDGKGMLDGVLPIIITNQGIEVKDGTLGARESGFLQFNSPKIQALGQSNPSMRIVTDALENFSYTKLNSQVSYHQGKAIFTFTLNGQNPDVKKGQAINLNVNLEEDIPSLLTSLQLSDRVSEPIRKRVQERLQQRNSNNTDTK